MKWLAGAALALVGCGGASTHAASLSTADRATLLAELRKADLDFADATDKRGLEGWVSYFANDGVQLSPRADVVRGQDGVREHMVSFFQKGDLKLTWKPLLVEVSPAGDMGYTYGPYEVVEVAPNGVPRVVRRGSYMTVWRHDVGGWKVIADLGSQETAR